MGRFSTLFCHECGVLEVSEALDDTGLAGKWDLQFGSAPRASRAQEIKKKEHFQKNQKNVLGLLGVLFCHEWIVLEVSEALDDTGLSGKMRSTIWEWSQSLQGSINKLENSTLKFQGFNFEFQAWISSLIFYFEFSGLKFKLEYFQDSRLNVPDV